MNGRKYCTALIASVTIFSLFYLEAIEIYWTFKDRSSTDSEESNSKKTEPKISNSGENGNSKTGFHLRHLPVQSFQYLRNLSENRRSRSSDTSNDFDFTVGMVGKVEDKDGEDSEYFHGTRLTTDREDQLQLQLQTDSGIREDEVLQTKSRTGLPSQGISSGILADQEEVPSISGLADFYGEDAEKGGGGKGGKYAASSSSYKPFPPPAICQNDYLKPPLELFTTKECR